MRKLFIFLSTFLIINCAFYTTAYAADYGYEYPDYIPVSGGAFVEVQSSLGTVALVFPIDYKDGYFGFVDSGSASVGNLSNNTIYGTLYTRSGASYSIRAPYGELIEYQTNSSYPYNQWVDLSMSEILNTNIQLIDLTDQGRETEFQYYDFTYKEKFFAIEIFLGVFVVCLIIILGVKNGNR